MISTIRLQEKAILDKGFPSLYTPPDFVFPDRILPKDVPSFTLTPCMKGGDAGHKTSRSNPLSRKKGLTSGSTFKKEEKSWKKNGWRKPKEASIF
jgi:hypothetical protein